MERPNILFINTDQQTWNVVSAYGNPHVRTPHMDRLHRNGTSFMRSYCADPVCSASRASWMTGRYTSENGVCFNAGLMHEDIPDLGQILNRNGYDAVHCGKWHIGGRSVRDSFQNLYTGNRDIAAGGAEYYDRVSTHALIDFLDSRNSSQPFYLQIGLVNPHDICEYEHTHEFKAIPGPEAQGFSPDALPPLPENFDYDERETVVQQVFRRGKQPLLTDRTDKRPFLVVYIGWDVRSRPPARRGWMLREAHRPMVSMDCGRGWVERQILGSFQARKDDSGVRILRRCVRIRPRIRARAAGAVVPVRSVGAVPTGRRL